MDIRRQLKWILISLLLPLAMMGMFFAYTFNSTWPEESMYLSASDMQLTHPISTSLCESVDLNSDHPFMAHHVADQGKINPSVLTRNTMDFNLELKRYQKIQLQYFLLPESIVTVVACASSPGSYVYILKGKSTPKNRVKRRINPKLNADYDDDESSENLVNSDEDDEVESEYDTDDDGTRTVKIPQKPKAYKSCPNILKSQDIPSTYMNDARMCKFLSVAHPIQLNITEADTYGIFFVNSLLHDNRLNIRLIIDRTTYSVNKYISNFHICPAGSTCTVPLSFCSKDRVLVWIPNEPQAGLTTYTVNARCRPRLALFLTLIIMLPILIFSLATFFMKIASHLSNGYSAVNQNKRNSCFITCTNPFNKNMDEQYDEHLTVDVLQELTDMENCDLSKRESNTLTLVTFNENQNQWNSNTSHELPAYEALCDAQPPPYSHLVTSSEDKM